jgi:hypothetical protein
MEVPPMLRFLFKSEPVKDAAFVNVTRMPVVADAYTVRAAVADKLRRRSTLTNTVLRYPKSVCTSLKDLCEL